MRWDIIFAITMTTLFITLFQWPKMKKNQKKEKIAFVCLSLTGWLLANFLFLFPNTPGPTDIIEFVFKPLGKLLE